MHLPKGRQYLFAGVAVATLCLTAPAFAQGQPAPEGTGVLEEVVVTSQRVETLLQRTPNSVTAVTGSALQERGATTIRELDRMVPSLAVSSGTAQGVNQGSFGIRGIGSDGNAQPSVGIYIDDVYYPVGVGNLLKMLDLDRVEVLRGPQGTLFGRNTIGGAIQFITKKPTDTLGGYFEASGGSNSLATVQGAINVPINEQLAVRVSLASDDIGGYVYDRYSRVKRGGEDNQRARLQVRWSPIEKLRVDLKAETIQARGKGRPGQVVALDFNTLFARNAVSTGGLPASALTTVGNLSPGKWENSGFNSPDSFKSFTNLGQGIVSYEVSDSLRLKSITAYIDSKVQTRLDFDATPIAIAQSIPDATKLQVFTQELQASGGFLNDRVTYTAGYYYYNSDEHTGATNYVLGPNAVISPISPRASRTKIEAHAVYGQATVKVTDRLSAFGGIRYSHETNDGENLTTHATAHGKFNNVSPAFGVNYQVTDDAMVYAKASRGFRAGGATVGVPAAAAVFEPDKAWTVEAGGRFEFLNRRVRINPTVYNTDWTGLQFRQIVNIGGAPFNVTQNAGNAHMYGAELETLFAVTDRLTLNGVASWNRGHYTSVAPTNTAGLTVNSKLQRMPEYKIGVGARYTHPLPGGARLVGNADYSYTSSQRSIVSEFENVTQPKYSLVNGRIEYQTAGGRWSVAGYVNNLFNKYYLIGGVAYLRGGVLPAKLVDPGRPREFGVTFRANF